MCLVSVVMNEEGERCDGVEKGRGRGNEAGGRGERSVREARTDRNDHHNYSYTNDCIIP